MKIVIWFTGLSGAGKTTIANALKKRLLELDKKVFILDGDEVRNTVHKKLGFTPEDISENNRLIADLAKEKIQFFDFVLVPIISPFRKDRVKAKAKLGAAFVELFVNCPFDECASRDVKGLYKKAKTGEIANFIGFHEAVPYEAPLNPEIEIKTAECNLEEAVDKVIIYFRNRGII